LQGAPADRRRRPNHATTPTAGRLDHPDADGIDASYPAGFPLMAGWVAGAELAAAWIGEPLLGVAPIEGWLRVVWANPAAQELFGQDADELFAADVGELLGWSGLLADGGDVLDDRDGLRDGEDAESDGRHVPAAWRDTWLLGAGGVHRP
jgi:hypothetical protein